MLVLDAHEPGWGASGRNNGQVVAALKHEPHEIEQRFGRERGGGSIRAIGEGPDLVLGLIARHRIECAARRCGILTAAHSPAGLADLERRVEIWNRRGAPLQLLSRDEMEAASGTGFYAGGLPRSARRRHQPAGLCARVGARRDRAGRRDPAEGRCARRSERSGVAVVRQHRSRRRRRRDA